jgi:hypothetical protein
MDSRKIALYQLTKFSSIKFRQIITASQRINATVNKTEKQILLIYEDMSSFGGGIPL